MKMNKTIAGAMRCALGATLFLNSTAFASSGVTLVNVSLDQTFEAPRWMFDPKAKVKGGALIEHMVSAKKALLKKDRGACIAALQKVYGPAKSLGPWLAWNHLQCALIKDKKGALSADVLSSIISRVENQPTWMLYGPPSHLLKVAYVNALLALAEIQAKTDRGGAWKTVNKLQQIRSWLTPEERANNYRWAGELAFVEQNLLAAQEFLMRSLSEKENADVRLRVDSIRSKILGDKA